MIAALDLDTAARLRATVGRLSRRLRKTEVGSQAGMTPTRISVLLHVARVGEVRLADLAADEGLNPTMLSRVVADLADAGLLERLSDRGDRRAAWVKPTEAGLELAESMRRERTEAINAALASLHPADRDLLEAALPALERLAETLREQRP